jgi:hypothetical protein
LYTALNPGFGAKSLRTFPLLMGYASPRLDRAFDVSLVPTVLEALLIVFGARLFG